MHVKNAITGGGGGLEACSPQEERVYLVRSGR